MRKLLKLTISMLICGLMLLSACTVPTSLLPSNLKAQKGYYPSAVNILSPDVFKDTGGVNTDQIRQQWFNEISERYGVSLHVYPNYDAYTKNTGYSGTVSKKAESEHTNFFVSDNPGVIISDDSPVPSQAPARSKYTGLIQVGSVENLKSVINGSEPYLPLDDYLADNPVWNALPEDFKSLYKINGHIYAIPTSVSLIQKARIIHNEAIEKAGITVKDLATFHDFAVSYKQNAKKFTDSLALSEVADILNAFGLYRGEDDYKPFGYDPTADCFTDWMTKPAAADALEYLRELYQEGALSNKYITADDHYLFKTGLWASEYAPYSDVDGCTELLTLNPEYPTVIFTDISGFAMTQDTQQPQETVNFMMDLLFGSEQNYLESWLGSSKNFHQNDDGSITVAMVQDLEGNYIVPPMPRLTGGLTEIFPYSDTDIIYSKNGVIASESEIKNHKARAEQLNDSLKNGSVVKIPPEYQNIQSATYDKNIGNFDSIYLSCFTNAIWNSDKTVRQILDEYKAKMLDLGGNAMLDEMNAAIGKKTAYYYG